MATKYIINNITGQTIVGGLKISGTTNISSVPPATLAGSPGDKMGDIAFDGNYLYYCASDYSENEAGSFIVTGGEPIYTFNEQPGLGNGWNTYYVPPNETYLQTGFVDTGDEFFAPQNGWYIVDDLGNIREVIGGSWLMPAQPVNNGPGWLMTLDGTFTLDEANTTLNFYTTLPTVTFEGNEIWKTIRFDATQNTTNTYKALLTQTGSIVGNNLNDFYDGLIIGETYTITNYVEDADFSNIADVQSGTINQTGCVFIATGEIPNSWNDNSQLTSDGGLVVNVLENTLGYDLIWDSGLFGNGVYYAANGTTGPIRNSFPRNYVDINVQPTPAFYGYEFSLTTINATPASIMEKDDIIFMSVYDANIGDFGYDNLYYTPIEINIKVNITPVVIIPTLNNSYPFYNASFYLGCNGNTNSYFSNDGTTVNNAQELSAVLNNSSETNFLGTFSDDGSGNIILTMTTSVKQQYCEDGSLTIEIFQD